MLNDMENLPCHKSVSFLHEGYQAIPALQFFSLSRIQAHNLLLVRFPLLICNPPRTCLSHDEEGEEDADDVGQPVGEGQLHMLLTYQAENAKKTGGSRNCCCCSLHNLEVIGQSQQHGQPSMHTVTFTRRESMIRGGAVKELRQLDK